MRRHGGEHFRSRLSGQALLVGSSTASRSAAGGTPRPRRCRHRRQRLYRPHRRHRARPRRPPGGGARCPGCRLGLLDPQRRPGLDLAEAGLRRARGAARPRHRLPHPPRRHQRPGSGSSDFIQREQIDCDWERVGRFHAAHNTAAFETLAKSRDPSAQGAGGRGLRRAAGASSAARSAATAISAASSIPPMPRCIPPNIIRGCWPAPRPPAPR